MLRNHPLLSALLVLALSTPAPARADIKTIARCQKRFATAGANFAKQVVKYTLKCTQAISECQILCEQGAFGPPCDTNPPPCCDPDDPGSNPAFAACLDEAQLVCDDQTARIARAEITKQVRMTNACAGLTEEELCGAQAEGLNFAALNAGCLALDPGYECTLPNLIACIGGPLERRFVDRISAVLGPRAGDAVAVLNLQSAFPDIPVTRKVAGEVAEGRADVYAITGSVGDEIGVRVRTSDDNGNGTSNLRPVLRLLEADATTPVGETSDQNVPCSVSNVCGSTCPQLNRTLPSSGTFYIALQAVGTGGCSGGRYQLVVVSPAGTLPVLVWDDIPATSPSGAFIEPTQGPLD